MEPMFGADPELASFSRLVLARRIALSLVCELYSLEAVFGYTSGFIAHGYTGKVLLVKVDVCRGRGTTNRCLTTAGQLD
eukprot:2487532-Amphidinium_carterae.2